MTTVTVPWGKVIKADRKQDRKLRTPLANAEWILDFNFVIPSELRVSYYAALINGHVCGFQ